MTTLEINVEEKQNVLDGKLTQAKGVVREQLGSLQNADLTRLAGKKDQVVGHIQANYGNSWLVRHSNWVLLGTAVVFLGTLLTVLLKRKRSAAVES